MNVKIARVARGGLCERQIDVAVDLPWIRAVDPRRVGQLARDRQE